MIQLLCAAWIFDIFKLGVYSLIMKALGLQATRYFLGRKLKLFRFEN